VREERIKRKVSKDSKKDYQYLVGERYGADPGCGWLFLLLLLGLVFIAFTGFDPSMVGWALLFRVM